MIQFLWPTSQAHKTQHLDGERLEVTNYASLHFRCFHQLSHLCENNKFHTKRNQDYPVHKKGNQEGETYRGGRGRAGGWENFRIEYNNNNNTLNTHYRNSLNKQINLLKSLTFVTCLTL